MSNEEFTPDQTPSQTQSQVEPQATTPMSTNLPNLATYMNFIGLLAMIGGVLYCITIIGAIIGVPYYIMGKRLREAAEAFSGYNSSSSARDIETAIDKQTRAFFIMYILAIISLVLLALYLVVIIGMLASGALR
jgi:flagellar biogenesis protein FliO